ncbi:papain family cysteine protease domain-containing protein [Ditylenchus destructor]|uniref:Papain family cysteine protease domain-containing protein n=1 Tax=Ditylenchus destructor TaxID=166010 RepID=A0AAD4QXJ8_9BILA|nr:papain family cysteine protease domain-containing protein [Ditylenchus destructor]
MEKHAIYGLKEEMMNVLPNGNCGSCWAFAAQALVESNYLRYYNSNNDLSEQDLVDCAPGYGCSGGWTDRALTYMATNRTTFESYYPYKAVQGNCIKNVQKWVNAPYYVYIGGESSVAYYNYHYCPVAFYFGVPRAFQYYTGGVFDVADCSSIIGYHEMVIIGYAPSYWIVKNSWGTGFGDNGYVYYARGKNLCNMQAQLICTYGQLYNGK